MTAGIRRFIASVLVVLFLALPGAVLAQEKRGANIRATLKDGSAVSGELIAVRRYSLVLLSPVGKDVSVEVSYISSIRIVKKSKAGNGFLIGMLVGGIAGGALYDEDRASLGIGGVVISFGILAGLIGAGVGAASGRDTTIDFSDLTEADIMLELDRLRGKARMRSDP
jgi:hypothetical protein